MYDRHSQAKILLILFCRTVVLFPVLRIPELELQFWLRNSGINSGTISGIDREL